jgi:hypothetical protein
MCPVCLTLLATTVASTTGAAATAVAVGRRVARSLRRAEADAADLDRDVDLRALPARIDG